MAARFGVSSSYMARVCTLFNVPWPDLRYWAKLAVGKPPKQPALPEPRPGDQLEWTCDGALPRRACSLPRPPDQKPRRNPSRGYRCRIDIRWRAQLSRSSKLVVSPGKADTSSRPRDCLSTWPWARLAWAKPSPLQTNCSWPGHRVVIAPNSKQLHLTKVDECENLGKGHHHEDPWSPMRCTVTYMGAVARDADPEPLRPHPRHRSGAGAIHQRKSGCSCNIAAAWH